MDLQPQKTGFELSSLETSFAFCIHPEIGNIL